MTVVVVLRTVAVDVTGITDVSVKTSVTIGENTVVIPYDALTDVKVTVGYREVEVLVTVTVIEDVKGAILVLVLQVVEVLVSVRQNVEVAVVAVVVQIVDVVTIVSVTVVKEVVVVAVVDVDVTV